MRHAPLVTAIVLAGSHLTLAALCADDETPPIIALRAARVFDGKSDKLISDGIVIVEGDKIAAVGTKLPVPDDARVIDLGDATLSPGFIDAHTHLTHERTDDWNKDIVDRFRRQVPEQAYYAAHNAQKVLEAGFTTVRDVGSRDFIDVGLRNAIARGLVPGPRMLVAVHGLGATGGHADRNGFRYNLFGKETDYTQGVANGPAALREAVRFQVKYGADVIKFCASGGVLSLADEVDTPQLTLEEMTALIDEAHRLRKKVAAHCHGDQAARALAMGVKIAFGTDSGVSPHGINAKEFALMTGLGMTPIAALKSATSVDSELLGISQKVGTLEKARLADIVAMPGDPTSDVTVTEKVFFVMKEGKVMKNTLRLGHAN